MNKKQEALKIKLFKKIKILKIWKLRMLNCKQMLKNIKNKFNWAII